MKTLVHTYFGTLFTTAGQYIKFIKKNFVSAQCLKCLKSWKSSYYNNNNIKQYAQNIYFSQKVAQMIATTLAVLSHNSPVSWRESTEQFPKQWATTYGI